MQDGKLERAELLLPDGGFSRWYELENQSVIVDGNATLTNAAASPATLRLLLIALVAGALLLFPSFYYLYRLFKGPRAFALAETSPEPPPE